MILETEIWPNLFFEASQAGCGIAVVNGRISDRAWPHYRKWSRLFRPVLALADIVLVQSPTDRERYVFLGVPESKSSLENNLKYDVATSFDSLDVDTFGAQQIWIAASTAGPNERGSFKQHFIDEDDLVIATFQKLAPDFPGLLLILAPRQPARFDVVAQKLGQSNLSFVRRTASIGAASLQQNLTLPGVLLLDTIGELAHLYPLASVVFVGGSLAPRGGHNIIEPAAAAAPIVIGPHMQNFAAITRDFLHANAVVQISDQTTLYGAIHELLRNEERAKALGVRAQQLVKSKRGASTQIADKLATVYFASYNRAPRSLLTTLLLNGLAHLWLRGGEIKRRRSLIRAKARSPLGVPVISIGGITVGGSGKTPFTVYLASQLKALRYSPAILTRGYRRGSPEASMILPIGSRAGVAMTGDEAQIFLRSKVGAVGIGSDRYETAQVLLNRLPNTSVLLLDDGFQHARMKRDLDVVLIDGLDPFGEYHAVPAGRLREPLPALDRAQMIVVTRAGSEAGYNAICAGIRQYNVHAPIFRADLQVKGWRDYSTGLPLDRLSSEKVAAFCGLGNPANFFNTLSGLGLDVVFQWQFDDHHRYKTRELTRLAHQARMHGAKILVTTEKDSINFPRDTDSVFKGLQVAFLEIEIKPVAEAHFLATLTGLLGQHSAALVRG